MTAELLRGEPVAADVRATVRDRVRALEAQDVVPTVGTVLMSDDPAAERFMELKHAACDDAGLSTRDVRLDPGESATRLYRAIDRLCADADVDAVFVQVPLPDHVSTAIVRERLDPAKDVDCFHPENLGRLVAGTSRFVPVTPAAVCALLDAYDIRVAGRDVVIVGRSNTIGKPLANRFLRKGPLGDATVTVCHSRTADLAAATRRAELIVTLAGTPGLVDGSMLSSGVVVVDVSANRRPVPADGRGTVTDEHVSSTADPKHETKIVGDVEFDSAQRVARAITPVPGGVGPVTIAMVLRNVVRAAERTASSVDTP